MVIFDTANTFSETLISFTAQPETPSPINSGVMSDI
jgi:hypothetical protein